MVIKLHLNNLMDLKHTKKMAINKKYIEKYKEFISMMKKLRYEDHEIEMKLDEMEDLDGWEPITFGELKEMSQEEKSKLMSYCWHDGNPRCDCIGIQDVNFTPGRRQGEWNVQWSDIDGDPHLHGYKLDVLIDNIGDGDWNYGLYKRKK